MREMIIRIAAVSLLCSAVQSVAPDGAAKKALGTLCAFVMLSVALSGLLSFNGFSYALELEKYRQEGERIASEGSSASRTETRHVIQDRCAAYILDKAARTDAEIVQCRVRTVWSVEGYWVPYSCMLCSQNGKSDEIAIWIEAELGIPQDRQEWTTREE